MHTLTLYDSGFCFYIEKDHYLKEDVFMDFCVNTQKNSCMLEFHIQTVLAGAMVVDL